MNTVYSTDGKAFDLTSFDTAVQVYCNNLNLDDEYFRNGARAGQIHCKAEGEELTINFNFWPYLKGFNWEIIGDIK